MNFNEYLDFLMESEWLKVIRRKNLICDGTRRENSAEHSWQICLMSITLKNYAKEGVDIFQVVKMLLIHDLVEIDAGDFDCHDENPDKVRLESEAALRIFGLLPDKNKNEFMGLWKEFEACETPSAQFANVMDRLQPFILHMTNDGETWKMRKIKKSQVEKRMKMVVDYDPELEKLVNDFIDMAVRRKWIKDQ